MARAATTYRAARRNYVRKQIGGIRYWVQANVRFKGTSFQPTPGRRQAFKIDDTVLKIPGRGTKN